jgi:hypothetical protein
MGAQTSAVYKTKRAFTVTFIPMRKLPRQIASLSIISLWQAYAHLAVSQLRSQDSIGGLQNPNTFQLGYK